MCSHPGCRKRLVLEPTEADPAATIGEAAHIVARAVGGPRGAISIDPAGRNGYANLILLCANHHSLIDCQPETYTVDVPRGWKEQHEAWVDGLAQPPVSTPWTAILHEGARWIHPLDIPEALGPANPIAGAIELRHLCARDPWPQIAAREFRALRSALSNVPEDRARFAVFSTGRIPLAVQLGYVLGDRSRVELFQYDRDRGKWAWPADSAPTAPVSWSLSETADGLSGEAAIRISLSAAIRPDLTPRAPLEIDISVPEPSVYWLRASTQLTDLAHIYAQALAALRDRGVKRIHLYYAGPAPGAIAFGRAYNPSMNPPLVVYDFSQTRYEPAIVLNRRAR